MIILHLLHWIGRKKKPPKGVVKINFNKTVLNSKLATAVIIRDSTCTVLGCKNKSHMENSEWEDKTSTLLFSILFSWKGAIRILTGHEVGRFCYFLEGS